MRNNIPNQGTCATEAATATVAAAAAAARGRSSATAARACPPPRLARSGDTGGGFKKMSNKDINPFHKSV